MTTLEAHMSAETIAAQLLDEDPDTEKLTFLRDRTSELLTYFDEQLKQEPRAA